jgi:precorrin-4/cobalt-precorrin-4 C11-methyltransferase
MTVHFIGVGPGAADLITVRAQNIISASPICLYAGSLIPQEILAYCPEDAELINSAPLDLDAIEQIFRTAHETGKDVARLHSGDVSIWSAMAEQIDRLKQLDIPYRVTPGVPSFAASAAALGVELTVPSIVQSVVLTRTSGRASSMPDTETLEAFAATRATLAIHLSIHVLSDVVDRLTPFYGPDCPCAVIYRASWPEEQIFTARLDQIASKIDSQIERTGLILVGKALDISDFTPSSLYAAGYDRRFRPASARQNALEIADRNGDKDGR